MQIRKGLGCFAAALAALALTSRSADACGGTFCDSGPTAMPVDQTGENVLFVMDGMNVEAHVQILYQGEAAKFAWVIPMPMVPTVEVGSQLLFTALLQGTVPTYGYTTQVDQCAPANFGGTSGASAGAGGAGGASAGIADAAGGPEVVFQKTVGAFDVTALQGGTAQEVVDWLATNGYQSVPAAPAILDDYVTRNFVFVAVKLTGGAGIEEIHPLVFRYPGNEPCVPLKLTAVAATQDMAIRVFFLGDDRVFPTNYRHIELNPTRIDWFSLASNYRQVVTRAADEPVADGQAFVTEYAGPSNVVNASMFYSPAWTEMPFTTIAHEEVVNELTRQGLIYCWIDGCQFSHPLVLPLLEQYLPAPSGIVPSAFYADLAVYSALIDANAWDAASFAADFKSRIVDPAVHANDVVTSWLYLTRMFTTMSPSEMTVDPLFHPRPDLNLEQVGTGRFATLRVACNGARGMILTDGREVALAPSTASFPPSFWPAFSSLMPWAERIEEVPLAGPVITLADNSAIIDEQLGLWNDSVGWPPPAASGGFGGTGSVTGGFGGSMMANDGGPENAATGASQSGQGCGCAVAARASRDGTVVAFGLLFAAFGRRRRRPPVDQEAPRRR